MGHQLKPPITISPETDAHKPTHFMQLFASRVARVRPVQRLTVRALCTVPKDASFNPEPNSERHFRLRNKRSEQVRTKTL